MKNAEGYFDPTASIALANVAKEERSGSTASVFRGRIYICSPYRAKFKPEINDNVARAVRYCRFVKEQGYSPLCPHIYFTQFLDDSNTADRKLGLALGLEWLRACTEVWVFGEDISSGMFAEIDEAAKLKTPIRYFNEKCEEVF